MSYRVCSFCQTACGSRETIISDNKTLSSLYSSYLFTEFDIVDRSYVKDDCIICDDCIPNLIRNKKIRWDTESETNLLYICDACDACDREIYNQECWIYSSKENCIICSYDCLCTTNRYEKYSLPKDIPPWLKPRCIMCTECLNKLNLDKISKNE